MGAWRSSRGGGGAICCSKDFLTMAIFYFPSFDIHRRTSGAVCILYVLVNCEKFGIFQERVAASANTCYMSRNSGVWLIYIPNARSSQSPYNFFFSLSPSSTQGEIAHPIKNPFTTCTLRNWLCQPLTRYKARPSWKEDTGRSKDTLSLSQLCAQVL